MAIKGFHHITINCSDAHTIVDFYRDVLGFFLVKQTVNFDDPFTYHIYLADKNGTPGTLLTFFPFAGLPKAHHANNEIRLLGFASSKEGKDYWKKKLEKHAIQYEHKTLFGIETLVFCDPDGLELAIFFTDSTLPACTNDTYPLQGLYSIQLHVHTNQFLEPLLQAFSYKKTQENTGLTRYEHDGSFVDVYVSKEHPHQGGFGSVHHLAFHVTNEQHKNMQEMVAKLGYQVTPVIDRQYFYSVYFRTFEGLLFEIATTKPGMYVDESVLGSKLCIPKQHKLLEKQIRERLPPL
ncbi:MAG: VOC family protein [Candidatus Woesearchaeota archaeon]